MIFYSYIDRGEGEEGSVSATAELYSHCQQDQRVSNVYSITRIKVIKVFGARSQPSLFRQRPSEKEKKSVNCRFFRYRRMRHQR